MLPDDVHATAATAPTVPGYLLTGVLGRGASATVWRAHPVSGGDPVAVKVMRSGPLAERELAVLTGVRHPHVVPLREVVALGDEQVAVVVTLLDGGTLGQLVAARGRLHPGEVVTCLAPLALAVADLHAQGVQHGDLAPGNVLFDRSGKPYLTDLGTVRVTGEPRDDVYGTAGFVDPVVLTGGAPSPASDVHGLGALAWFALTGAAPPGVPSREPLAQLVGADVPAAMVALVEAAVDPDADRRPSPSALARGLHESAVAVPVWRRRLAPTDDGGLTHRVDRLVLPPAVDDGPRHRRERSRRRRRVVVAGAAAAAIVLAAGAAGVGAVVVGHDEDGPGRRSAPAPGPPSAVLAPAASMQGAAVPGDRLDLAGARGVVVAACTARARAFAAGRGSTGVAPGSAAEQADRSALSELSARGVRYRSLRLVVRSVRLVSTASGRAVVDVVVDTSAYQVVDRTGRVLSDVAAEPGRRSRLDVVRTPDGWRVARVRSL